MNEYIIISFAEEGYVHIKYGSKQDVEKILEDVAEEQGNLEDKFVGNQMIVKGFDSEYKSEEVNYLIIKGKVVEPKPVTKVTKWEI